MKFFSNLQNKSLFIITFIFNILLIVAVIALMRYTQDLLHSDARTNLTEMVKKNCELIIARVNLEIQNQVINARQLAAQFTDKHADAFEMHIALMSLFGAQQKQMFVASKNGEVSLASSIEPINIAERSYFRLALAGKSNISKKIRSYINGEELFIISVPIYYQGKIIGTLQKKYYPQELFDICIPPLFASEGRIYIINHDGTIILHSNDDTVKDNDNFFNVLHNTHNLEQEEQFRYDINHGLSNILIALNNENEDIFYAYEKIANVHNWYVVTSVDTDVIARHAKTIINLFYVILLALSCFFGITIFYILILKQKEKQELQRIAFEDPITHGATFNRLLHDLPRLVQAAPEKPWSLLAFDIDNFRYINSYYGFGYGNVILQQVNNAISQRLNAEEQLTHIWGDYFAALLCRQDPLDSSNLLEPMKSSGNVKIHFSGGIYPIVNIYENVHDMYDKARLAALQIKGDVHTSIKLYDEDLSTKLLTSEKLKQTIQEALKNQELLPYYQPKIDINTRKLVGAEALARWRRPSGQLISPAEFIPICESTGLIVEVDFLIYEKVLRFLHEALKGPNSGVPISINFSRRHLDNQNFLDHIIKLLHKYNIPPHLIDIELTESLFYDNQKTMIKLSNELKEHGIKVSMDDFGSGYSSLAMLKDVHIDTLKIDQNFLHAAKLSDILDPSAEDNQINKRSIIFKSIIAMANKLKINVVVEGVETEENVNLMKESACTVAQGFFYSKPLPPEIFAEIYAQGTLN